MARWARAIAWLPPDARRVLDDGAAFGFTTVRVDRALRRRSPAGLAVGMEYDPTYVAQARDGQPRLRLVRGSAAGLPFADGAFDAVLLLDVLEHLPAEAPAIAEAWRALRPGGTLILSVPYRGPLAWADSLNLYGALRERLPFLLPLDATERGFPCHRHYSVADLRAHLRPRFRIERVARTGLGLAEPINLLLLLLCRGLLRSHAAYGLLRFVYYTAYLAEDVIPAGRWGYHLMIRARRLPVSAPAGRAARRAPAGPDRGEIHRGPPPG
jgi:SAM-dependent methyltransferase